MKKKLRNERAGEGESGGETKKKVDKKRVTHNGVVGPSFIFSNLFLKKSCLEPRERSVAFKGSFFL